MLYNLGPGTHEQLVGTAVGWQFVCMRRCADVGFAKKCEPQEAGEGWKERRKREKGREATREREYSVTFKVLISRSQPLI